MNNNSNKTLGKVIAGGSLFVGAAVGASLACVGQVDGSNIGLLVGIFCLSIMGAAVGILISA